MRASTPPEPLDAEQRAELEAGRHETLAASLREQQPALAAWILEQVWEFDGASSAWLDAGRPVDALRTGLESRSPDALEHSLRALEARREAQELREAVKLLESRRRHAEAARLLALDSEDPAARARALVRAGDPFGAAEILAEAGQAHEALELLLPIREGGSGVARRFGLAARLSWDLGDAEGTARFAQATLRAHAEAGLEPTEGAQLRPLLARALGSLGHDLAAQIVLQGAGESTESTVDVAPVRGRYHVTGLLPAHLAGSAYVGYDRVTLQEVEVHVLLSDYAETDRPPPEILDALEAFVRSVDASQGLAHPAVRTVLRADASEGIVVMPRAEGPPLRSMIRPPGMASTAPRARGLAAFLLEGLAAAHGQGLVHGSVQPSQIVTDAVGRPLLGPFGAHHLAGLVTTRTGGLEELLAFTAPELRAGGTPSPAADVFAVGVLLRGLLLGTLEGADLDQLPTEERELIEWATQPDPTDRPTAAALLEHLSVPVADVSRLGGALELTAASGSLDRPREAILEGLEVQAGPGWDDALLERIAESSSPWLQTILDRDGRTFILAAWPEGCRTAGAGADWRSLLDEDVLDQLDPEVASSLATRLDGEALVATPAGEWIIALDRLLPR